MMLYSKLKQHILIVFIFNKDWEDDVVEIQLFVIGEKKKME